VRPCAGLAKCSGWGFWSECSQTCNSEKSVGSKVRKCVRSDDMYECKGSAKVQCSHLPPCPVDGGYSDWSGCSRSCGHGVESRTCTNPEPKYGGANCSTLGDSQRPCLGGVCPADGGFGAWGQCDASCGVGVRKRECDDPKPEFGGKACSGLALEICVTASCHSDIAGNTFHIATDADATEFLDFETGGGGPLTAADRAPQPDADTSSAYTAGSTPNTDTSSANTTGSTPTVADLTGPAAAAVGGLAAGPVASGSLIQLREGARRSASGGSLVGLPERYAAGISSRRAVRKQTTTQIVYSDDDENQQHPHPRRTRRAVYAATSPDADGDEEMHVFEGEAARTSRASASATTTRRGASAHAPGRFRAVHIVEPEEPNKKNNRLNGDGNQHRRSEAAAAAAAAGGAGSARHSISRYLMQVATGALPRESSSSSSSYSVAGGGHHSVRIDPANATATSSSSTASAEQALEAAMRNESSQAPVLSPLDPATHVIFTVRKTSSSSRADAISAPAFRLEKLTPDGFSYLIALAADCPADHSTVDLGCKAYLGMDGGHLVLTDEVEKRLVAMEAGQDGVFLRFGGAGGEGKWVNVDDDGIYLSPMFSAQEHWFLKPKIQPVDGGWSVWGPCVGGLKNRNCTNPSPMYDGKPCVGDAQVQCCDEACKGAAAASVIGPHLKNLNQHPNANGQNQTDSDSTEDHPSDALAPAWPSASDPTAAADTNLTGDANTTDTSDNTGGPSPLDIITGDYLQHPLNATQTSPDEEGDSHVQISSNCLVDLGLFDYSQGLGLDYEDIVSRLKLKILTESDKVTPEAAERRARQLLETSC